MAHYLNVASTTSTAGPEPSSRAIRHTPHESGKVRNQFHLSRLAALYVDPLFALYRIDRRIDFCLGSRINHRMPVNFHAGCSPNVMTLGVGWTRDRYRAASRRTRRVCAPSDPESTPAFWALVVRMLVYCQSVSHNSRQDTKDKVTYSGSLRAPRSAQATGVSIGTVAEGERSGALTARETTSHAKSYLRGNYLVNNSIISYIHQHVSCMCKMWRSCTGGNLLRGSSVPSTSTEQLANDHAETMRAWTWPRWPGRCSRPCSSPPSLGEGTLSCDSVRLRFVGLDSGDGEEGEDLVSRLPGELAGVLVLVPPLARAGAVGRAEGARGAFVARRTGWGGSTSTTGLDRDHRPDRGSSYYGQLPLGVSTRGFAGRGVVSIGAAAGRGVEGGSKTFSTSESVSISTGKSAA
ncbi:hypothetical protein L1887_51895 [Cichorium endivia]|nr:hypothetical protein L1887_51895 [Cichorium endivia]